MATKVIDGLNMKEVSRERWDMIQYYITNLEESNGKLSRKVDAAESAGFFEGYKYVDKHLRYTDGSTETSEYFGYWKED